MVYDVVYLHVCPVDLYFLVRNAHTVGTDQSGLRGGAVQRVSTVPDRVHAKSVALQRRAPYGY